MKVTLLHATPLSVVIHATRTCYDSFDKSDDGGEADRALLKRIVVDNNHGSVFEHCNFTFFIEGITRGTLQELVRHRHSYQGVVLPEWDGRDWSPSVKSTRYTLKELKKEEPFIQNRLGAELFNYNRSMKYIALPEDEELEDYAIEQLEILRKAVVEGHTNDKVKDLIPDCYLTNLTMTINGRSLRNFIKLRTDNSVYWRMRDLAKTIYNSIPESHKFLFEDVNYACGTHTEGDR